jgi:predicted ATPase
MDSQSGPKTQKSPGAQRNVRVVEDKHGHSVLSETIKSVKLSLMNTGMFFMSEEQKRLMQLAEEDIDDASNDFDEDMEIVDHSDGFNPYDSSK